MSEKLAPQSYQGSNFNDDESRNKFLVFGIDEDHYGVPLLGVREVLEPMKIKELPNTVQHFLGVINIRGEIVGVIDLRLMLDQKEMGKNASSMIVFETVVGPVAALVDKVESVATITENLIDSETNIGTTFAPDYLIGVAKYDESLITLIDLNTLLGSEKLKEIKDAKDDNHVEIKQEDKVE